MNLKAQKQYALNRLKDKSYSRRLSKEDADYLIGLTVYYMRKEEQLPKSREYEFLTKAKALFAKGTTEREFENKVNLLYLEEFMQ